MGGECIDPNLTDRTSHAHRPQSGEPDARIRAELTEQIASSQALLESQIDLLRHAAAQGGDTGTLVLAEQQLARLAGLQHHVAHGGDAATLRAAVRATVEAVQAIVPQTRTSAANGHAADRALHQAVDQARRVTDDFVHDFYERRIFDPYLSFASPEEEQAYRDREEARQRAIEAARALGTPEGDLLAVRLSREQLEDAGRHGADRSPDYAASLDALRTAEEGLGQALGSARETEGLEALSTADSPASAAGEAPIVSPDILASLRNAGVSMAPPDASLPTAGGIRQSEPGRGPS